ncbi:MAG: methyltransferase domain-containing protein, partial [Chloroflexota bacterium]|nr:methyltransferase domain-containing protein [Chloroflexota bacterium]
VVDLGASQPMTTADPRRAEVLSTYARRARHYDLTANLYYLIGLREWAYRKQAVESLSLRPGDTVVEIGCGTGLNFPLLRQAVGATGKVVGIDLTPAMLDVARQRIARHGWTNVELVQCDAAAYDFPDSPDGILSTFALSLVPECGEIVARGTATLPSGKRWVVLDLRQPSYWPNGLISPLIPLVRPFAVTEDVIGRRPWEAILDGIRASSSRTSYREFFAGFIYLAVGER